MNDMATIGNKVIEANRKTEDKDTGFWILIATFVFILLTLILLKGDIRLTEWIFWM